MAPGPYSSRTINAGPQSTIAPSLYDSGVINAGPHTAMAPGTYSAPIGLAHSRQDNYYSNQSRGLCRVIKCISFVIMFGSIILFSFRTLGSWIPKTNYPK